GAAGGIGTPRSALAAFAMGADYVVTGSVNQACVEAGTSAYVKGVLSKAEMSDVVMSPCADMFEVGGRVQVVKKGTMFPMNAQKLYDIYSRYPSWEVVPEKDKKAVESRILKLGYDKVWELVKDYFAANGSRQLARAEANEKYKLALVFRWYLGNASRWAISGAEDRKMDMQIWCGQSMGAFNKWAQGTEWEDLGARTAAGIAKAIMEGAAVLQLENALRCVGINILA
ncbi:MAG: malonyl CoA-ACP transacylase, partial [Clostridiales bacterium]|nr:malonyl CoA-ACP transacylase [Clostridiales bacterium]